jgi:tripartite-type tricarboxylate transporter receptor subunit TctC
MAHVPYKGSAPAVTDMLSGQVQVMFDNLPTVLEQVRSGNLRALAVTTANRAPTLPDVPTVAESGVAAFDTSAWFALLVAKDTPPSVRTEIERAAVQALKEKEVRSKLKAVGIEPLGGGSSELSDRIKVETQMWRDVVSKAGIKVE